MQVAALCRQPSGGVPATFLSSQQSKGESDAVYNELRKVRRHPCDCRTLRATRTDLAANNVGHLAM